MFKKVRLPSPMASGHTEWGFVDESRSARVDVGIGLGKDLGWTFLLTAGEARVPVAYQYDPDNKLWLSFRHFGSSPWPGSMGWAVADYEFRSDAERAALELLAIEAALLVERRLSGKTPVFYANGRIFSLEDFGR